MVGWYQVFILSFTSPFISIHLHSFHPTIIQPFIRPTPFTLSSVFCPCTKSCLIAAGDDVILDDNCGGIPTHFPLAILLISLSSLTHSSLLHNTHNLSVSGTINIGSGAFTVNSLALGDILLVGAGISSTTINVNNGVQVCPSPSLPLSLSPSLPLSLSPFLS